jgi:uncharacterized protein YjbI with pentapeptide repeats
MRTRLSSCAWFPNTASTWHSPDKLHCGGVVSDRSNLSEIICAEDGCLGVPMLTGDRCWAHARGQDLEVGLEQLREDGRLDASGVQISEHLLGRLLANLPHDSQGRPVLQDARFDQATFQGEARFTDATFQGAAWFNGATFRGAALFTGAVFEGAAWFNEATFLGDARFSQATFYGAAFFGEAAFQRDAHFNEVSFQRDAQFDRATVQRDGWFQRATFQRAQQIGPILVRKGLVLDEAVFHERIQVQISAAAVCCRRTRFLSGVQLRIRWAQVALGLADLAAPSLLANARPFSGLEEGRWARALERLWADKTRGSRPRLLALRRADVAGLTLSGVDLRACRFIGAHHLDHLRVEESNFPFTPMGWRWTPRQTIAEEHHWRACRLPSANTNATSANTTIVDTGRRWTGRTRGWYRSTHRPPLWLGLTAHGLPGWGVMPPNAAQVAAIYRALRKGREDTRDEPGAADFYYGEMEMRRHAAREEAKSERRYRHYRHSLTATTEHIVLWLYWLMSGYGLRAWRALATLTIVIALAGVWFSQVGFNPPRPSLAVSWLYALQATISLEGRARQLSGQLTLPGELLRVGMRLMGPILLGLAVLSIRGRVKR